MKISDTGYYIKYNQVCSLAIIVKYISQRVFTLFFYMMDYEDT